MPPQIQDISNYDFRRFDTEHAISSLRTYLDLMARELAGAYRRELDALVSRGPEGDDGESHDIFRHEQDALEQLFQTQMEPAMRFSVVTLIHTILETQLRAFCAGIQKERKLALKSGDLRGSAIDQSRTYLTKLAGMNVAQTPEWDFLISCQKVRDCIVHGNGYLTDSNKKDLIALANRALGVAIVEDRLTVSRGFCDEYLNAVSRLFESLFRLAGWSDGSTKAKSP